MSASRRIVQALAVVCLLAACEGRHPLAPGEGQLRISFTMTGLDLDPDGAHVTVDSTTRVGVGTTGAVTLDLEAGVHTVVLGGLAGNCTVTEAASREVDVRRNDVTDILFGATCGTASGVVEVSVRTQGVDPDADGYLVRVDAGVPQRILSGTVARFAPIPGGSHALRLDDVAANCAVRGGNPVTDVSVTTGGPVRDTARVAVTVECVSRFGDLRIITTTSGPADADGYVFLLEQQGQQTMSRRVGANDTVVVTNLVVGAYGAQLTDVAGNCAMTGSPPVGVTIASRDTATVRYAVACTPPAVLRVSAPTTGSARDPMYIVLVDNVSGYVLEADSTTSVHLTEGEHSVRLTEVAANCSVGGPNPVIAHLTAGATTDVAFPVTCAAGSTGLDVTFVTSGARAPASYRLIICQEPQWDCYAPVYNAVVPGNTAFQVDLAPGQYFGWLDTVASNCRERWTWDGLVTAGQRAAVRIQVTCLDYAEFVATLTTTGTDRQNPILLSVDGDIGGAGAVAWLESGVPTTLSALEGVHVIGLQNVQENCRATSPNPVTVSLVPGARTPVQFAVDCQPFPIVVIAVSSSGTNIPAGYLVGLDPDLFDGYAFTTPVTANGTVATRLNLGEHTIWLDQVPANCTVNGANPVTVTTAGLGTTTEVAFAVTCR